MGTDSGGDGKGVSAGFLFGNIDRRGRLDEEYLEDDAKDNLGNVAGEVASHHDRELQSVTERRKIADAEDDDNYDENDEDQAEDPAGEIREHPKGVGAEDYADETEILEDGLDEEEREAYARMALEAAHRKSNATTSQTNDDEDYDDDGDDNEDDGQPKRSPEPPSPASVKAREGDLQADAMKTVVEGNLSCANGQAPMFARLFVPKKRKIPRRPRRRGHLRLVVPEEVVEYETDEEDDIQRRDADEDVVEAQRSNEDDGEDSDDSLNLIHRSMDERRRELMEQLPVNSFDDDTAYQPLHADRPPLQEAGISKESHHLMFQSSWEREICWSGEELDDEDEDLGDVSSRMPHEAASLKEEPRPNEAIGNDDDEGDEEDWEEAFDATQPQADDTKPDPDEAVAPTRTVANDAVTHSAPQVDEKGTDVEEGAKTTGEEADVRPPDIETVAQAAEKPIDVVVLSDDEGTQGVEDKPKRGKRKDGKKPTSSPEASQSEAPTKKEKPVDGALVNYVRKNMPQNLDLEGGSWLDQVVWDSDADQPSGNGLSVRFSNLILDMNDPSIVLEKMSNVVLRPKRQDYVVGELGDPFLISNDRHYQGGGPATNRRAVRKAVLRGLRNSQAAEKCHTTEANPSGAYLFSFHRPVLTAKTASGLQGTLAPIRRRRPKAGPAQIAGQIPKRRTDLSCATKDAFRISIFEYVLERTPVILPICGTGSRLVTYARKSSGSAATQASVNALGTPDADTVFIAPEDPPPLHAGDILVDGPPLTVLESHLSSAPVVKHAIPPGDFLVVKRDGKYFVREVESVYSVGEVEPRVEVIAPNTERFKRYVKDRVLLWILREFMKQKKNNIARPALKKGDVYEAFPRRRTYPETSLLKTLKELSTFEGGNYFVQEPDKGFATLESELLRTVTAEETAAFESMEAGWEFLMRYGVRVFTHPTSQGNIAAAAEKTGDSAKAAVGNYLRALLMKAPWHRSQIMLANQRAQRKDLISILQISKSANELTAGFSKAQSRINQMSTSEMYNLLNQHFKMPAKKIPDDIEARRQSLSEIVVKKPKGPAERIDLSQVISETISKHRVLSTLARGGERKDPGLIHQCIPIAEQLGALQKGLVDGMPYEDDGSLAVFKVDLPAGLAMAGDGSGVGGFSKGLGAPVRPKKKTLRVTTWKIDEVTGERRKEQKVISDPAEVKKILEEREALANKKKKKSTQAVRTSSDNPLKISIGLSAISRRPAPLSTPIVKTKPVKLPKPVVPKKPKVKKTVGKIRIDTKKLAKEIGEKAAKRRRAQYSDELAAPRRKKIAGLASSRRRKNGEVALNAALEKIEDAVRAAEGFIAESVPVMVIKRVKPGVEVPVGVKPANLANPKDLGLDFTIPVHSKEYKDKVKDQMYLQRIKTKCKDLQYKSPEQFMDDIRLIVANTKTFHTSPAGHWVIQHAELLLETAEEKMQMLQSEIDAAMEQIRKSSNEGAAGETSAATTPAPATPMGSPAPTPGPESPPQMSPSPADEEGHTRIHESAEIDVDGPGENGVFVDDDALLGQDALEEPMEAIDVNDIPVALETAAMPMEDLPEEPPEVDDEEEPSAG